MNGSGLLLAVAVAAALEALVGEPPARIHPVALLGRAVAPLGERSFSWPALAGAVAAVGVPAAAAGVAYLTVAATAALGAAAAAVTAGLVLWTTTSLRLLLSSAADVIEASDDDPAAAKAALPALAGRDAASLSPPLLRSAAVESLAENLSDGLVGPLSAFVALSFVSLPAAAAAAAAFKAVNTMDSMFGYPGRFGWASARLDDLVMFVPARLSAALLGPAAADPDAPVRARRYADKPASPNAGWPMGTLAAALNVRLEKPDSYRLNELASLPTTADGRRALSATRRAGIAAYVSAALVGVVQWL